MLISLIEKHLQTNEFGKNIIYFDETDSTNLAAKRVSANYPHGSVVIADNQTAGIGRLGRSWVSEKGAGIYMSLILKSGKHTNQMQNITLAAAVSVLDALNTAVSPQKDLFQIKWPNDILSGGRKVCGILTQSVSNKDFENVIIIGIGVNVNNSYFDNDLSNATSLKIITGSEYSGEYVTALIINELEKIYSLYDTSGFAAIVGKYKLNCSTLNKCITITALDNKTAYAYDISENGELAVICEGKKILLYSGEVSVRHADINFNLYDKEVK